ncbi:MAG: PDZ domain-containing protein [Planctomycetes bacterium]|nr:PDZ domain-containing protein [Planctomycetota bacterium]
MKATGVCVLAVYLSACSSLIFAVEPMDYLDFRDVVRDAKSKVFPAVIYIKCLRESHESGKKINESVSGSGVIISADGEALTNWHVVDKAVEVRCLLYDGRAMEATVVGTDQDTDLALIKLTVDEGESVPFAALADSSLLTEGDFVMAMGAPWGMSRSVSIGIVSCTRRYLPENSEYSLWIQTDAAISPGNSGGPLVNTDGRVVGINSRGILYGGDIGFALPSETLLIVVPRLRQFGKVNWSWLGLQLQPLRDFEKNVYFEVSRGVIVGQTEPDSPASRAGIQARDRIVAIDGRAVTATNAEDLPAIRRQIGLLAKGKAIEVELIRNDKPTSLVIEPTEKGRLEGNELDCPRWDMTVKAINRFANPDLYFYKKEGVFIFGIKYPGNAQNSALQEQDIILQIDGTPVTSLEDVRRIHAESLKTVHEKPRLVFSVLRKGTLRMCVLDISRDYEKE